MFFAEVRPFDEIFRESQGCSRTIKRSTTRAAGRTSPASDRLQKQILSATWKLQREPVTPKLPEDTAVVHDSQQQALAQAQENLGKARNRAARHCGVQ